MEALLLFLRLIFTPIMILNALGGIVSGIWLAFLGQWWALGYGLASAIFSVFALSFLLLPSIGLSALAALFAEKFKNFFVYVFGFFSSLYVGLLMTAWCSLVMLVFLARADQETLLPLLIWSYGIATGPWLYLAQGDLESGEAIGTNIALSFASLGYIVMMVRVYFFASPIFEVVLTMATFMLVSLIIQFAFGVMLIREQKYQNHSSEFEFDVPLN